MQVQMSRRERFLGCMVGSALGDATGYPVEFLSPALIKKRYGRNGIMAPPEPALWSDDTQMAFAVVNGMLDASTHATEDVLGRKVAERFVEWRSSPENNRSPGGACMRGTAVLSDDISKWRQTGGAQDGGCGSVMRSHPYGLWHIGNPGKAAFVASTHSGMTHRHPGAKAASAALAAAVSVAADGQPLFRIFQEALFAANVDDAATADLIRSSCISIIDGKEPVEVLDVLRGWNGWEAIAAGFYCFMSFPESYVQCIRLAANTPGDSDSIAAIAGALSGAYLGLSAIPEDWVARLEHRDSFMATINALTDARAQEGGR